MRWRDTDLARLAIRTDTRRCHLSRICTDPPTSSDLPRAFNDNGLEHLPPEVLSSGTRIAPIPRDASFPQLPRLQWRRRIDEVCAHSSPFLGCHCLPLVS